MGIQVRKEPRKKQGKKHAKAKVTTQLALPSGASPSNSRKGRSAASSQQPKDALSAINFDDDLSESEKKVLEHKTYEAGGTTPTLKQGTPGSESSDATSGRKRRPKKGKRHGKAKEAAAPAAAAVPDPTAPQVMCGASAEMSLVCRVMPDATSPTQLTVQIAVQNRSVKPWVNASFDFKPHDKLSLLSRSLPNPFAVAASSAAPLLCVFDVKEPVVSALLVEGSFRSSPEAPAVAAAFRVHPILFVAPHKISLEELGRKIAETPQLKSSAATINCRDQKSGIRQLSEWLRVKKIRIDQGAALFYGKTAQDVDIFVHIKRANETQMVLEIKTLHAELSRCLVEYGASAKLK